MFGVYVGFISSCYCNQSVFCLDGIKMVKLREDENFIYIKYYLYF